MCQCLEPVKRPKATYTGAHRLFCIHLTYSWENISYSSEHEHGFYLPPQMANREKGLALVSASSSTSPPTK